MSANWPATGYRPAWMEGLLSTILVCSVLIAYMSSTQEAIGAESAEILLERAEKTLLQSKGLSVDYGVKPEDTSGWPGVVVGGRLVLQGDSRFFLQTTEGFPSFRLHLPSPAMIRVT